MNQTPRFEREPGHSRSSLLGVCTLLALVACCLSVALELGAYTRTQIFTGPFQFEEGRPDVLAVPLRRSLIEKLFIDSGGDTLREPKRSGLRLWIQSREVPKAHALHAHIAKAPGEIFSHWNDNVLFSLPAGVQNDAMVEIRVTYDAYLKAWLSLTVWFSAFLLVIIRFPRLQTHDNVQRILRIPYATAYVVLALAAFAIATFFACTMYGSSLGNPLPWTAAYAPSALASVLIKIESNFPFVCIGLACAACIASAWAKLSDSDLSSLHAADAGLAHTLAWLGAPLIFAFYMFTASRQWSGHVLHNDLYWASLSGLVPFSDAGGYFADAYVFTKTGVFSEFAGRRPIAAAFRTTIVAGVGYSFPKMVVVQAALLSMATYAASQSIARWRGGMAGLLFMALAMITVRDFVPTTLTEPLGLVWALLSIPLLVRALQTRSAIWGGLYLAILGVALFTRMGAMFLLPAVALWMVMFTGYSLSQRTRALVLAVGALVAAVGFSKSIQVLYTDQNLHAGSNLSYTLCGISIGEIWSGCVDRYPEVRKAPHDETAVVKFLYEKAYENFKASPMTALTRVLSGQYEFVRMLHRIVLQGYALASPPVWFPFRLVLFALCLALLMRFVAGGMNAQTGFWMLFLAGAIASAGIVYFDDGRRVLSVAYPGFWALAAFGLSPLQRPLSRHDEGARLHSQIFSLSLIFICAVATVLGPAMVRSRGEDRAPTMRGNNNVLILGGSRMAGVLVVPDGTPRRMDSWGVSYSAFAQMVKQSNVEMYEPLLARTPDAPFSLVFGLRPENAAPSGVIYIAPAELLKRSAVYWDLTLESGGVYWRNVRRAEPKSP